MSRNAYIRQSVLVSTVLMAALFLGPMAVIPPFPERAAAPPLPQEQAEEVIVPRPAESRDAEVILTVLVDGKPEQMDLGSYLVGVLRAEMPAAFHPEALKAQAAAARTYTLHKMLSGSGHGDAADVCTDAACCQAYRGEAAAREEWGEQAETYEKKVREAVAETDGQAILYGGVPILAVFHAASAGVTRSAGQVWQSDLPYLRAVRSPGSAEAIPDYYSRAVFTAEEFRVAVGTVCPEAKLTGDVGKWLSQAVTDEAGSVETVKVGGVTVKGSTLRAALGLRSACFEWEAKDGALTFYVTGYGHGVGLSQYGANRMAQEGAGWREILTHYYSGVTIGAFSAAGM